MLKVCSEMACTLPRSQMATAKPVSRYALSSTAIVGKHKLHTVAEPTLDSYRLDS